MSLSSGVLLLASWLLEEEMVVLDMAEEMVVPLPLPLMLEEFVVFDRILEMMSLPLLLMSEEFVVLDWISEMMMLLPLPLMPEEFVACCCHYC
jgi:hypothetical protein